MTLGLINVDWLNENTHRNYPLADGASRVAANGLLLPNGLLVDLSLPVPLGVLEPKNAFIQRVYGFTAGVVITIADKNNPTVALATATAFVDTHKRNDSYPVIGQGSLSGAVGRVTIGLKESLAQAAGALYDYSTVPAATPLVVSTIRPLLRGLNGIVVQHSDGSVSRTLGGTVTIKEGSNVSIAVDTATGSLTISSGLIEPDDADTTNCGCDDGLEPDEGAIRTINGIGPDQDGNFTLAGYNCTELTAVSGGLQIQDRCVDPCCGCQQVDALYTAVQAIENEFGRVQEVSEQLRGRIENLASALSNAALNPPGTCGTGNWWYLPIGTGEQGGPSVVPGN